MSTRALACALLAGCFTTPDHAGTMYRCDVDPTCPDGFSCIAGVCTMQMPTGDMIAFPPDTFMMGCTSEPDCTGDAQPAHAVTLSGFAIDKTEVTEAAFQQCIAMQSCAATTAPLSGASDLPVRGLTWDNARSYCAFAGKRLPTEAEWERAARDDGATPFPWGSDAFTCDRANALPCARGMVVAESALPTGATSGGVVQLAGNVREWVSDTYDASYYASSPTMNPQGPTTGNIKVTRGGAYDLDVKYLEVYYRGSEDPLHGGASYANLGVRCARPL